jgi:hypothetical protein
MFRGAFFCTITMAICRIIDASTYGHSSLVYTHDVVGFLGLFIMLIMQIDVRLADLDSNQV